MNRFLATFNILSLTILLFALTMALPLSIASMLKEGTIKIYLQAILITAAFGGALRLVSYYYRREMRPRDAFLLVVLIWTLLPLFATLPLLLYLPGLSFTDAYFETISGLTTTGATILSNLDSLPASLNVWRSFLIWIGGMGILILAVAVLPLLGVGGSQLYRTATAGPIKETKLTPRITETARWLFIIYLSITAVCMLVLKTAGMSWLDALIHSFSVMGLGAFSSHDKSIAYFQSPAIEIALIFFMFIASMNFATHFLAWRKLSFDPYRKDLEAHASLAVILISMIALAIYLCLQGSYSDFWTALRHAGFNTVSIATTTGFSNADYSQWPIFVPLWMLLLSVFASSSGSAGGGIKMIRAELIVRQTLRELSRIMHPKSYTQVKLAKSPIENKIVFAVLALIPVYVGSIVLVTLILTATGLDIVSAFSAAMACINNIGPGLNEVGPASTYAMLDNTQMWVCIVAMLLGRLELFSLLIVLTPTFWRR